MYPNVKRALRLLALLGCLVAIVAVPAAYAQDANTSGSATEDQNASSVNADEADNTSPLWFVELKRPPAADGTSLSTLKAEKDAFRDEAKNAGIKYKERFAFDTLWNGLSVELNDTSQAAELGRLPSVNTLYPVATVSLPETETGSDPELETALAMTGADVAQSELEPPVTGAGIKVAVMDTGIDYNHPDLGGGFGSDYRVKQGYDFVGDAFNADSTSPSYNPNPVPDPNPDDNCNGHGTHVAGIVGANGDINQGGAKGVAPDVTFGAYRVLGCEGSTTADIMIAAMERALADDMDVLNMSIGAAFQWPQYPTAQAADRLVNKGVSVVASIGNSGANGLYAAGAPGLGEKVIGVASFENTHANGSKFTISSDNRGIVYLPATDAPPSPTSGGSPMARTGTATSTADACTGLPANSLTGKVALIRRGTCSFYIKALNAQKAGAVGVVLYNNTAGPFTATVEGTPAVEIPVVSITAADGVLINNRLARGPVEMTWTDQTGNVANPTGGLISSFSSYGVAPDLTLKPDIGAPGGFLRSTYPIELGSYNTISGTSMASPYVAGAAALLLKARPNTSPQAVRSILQNSADPKPWGGNPALGVLDNVHRQGAGMLDIDDAIQSETKIEPGKLSLGESEAGPVTNRLTIENSGSSAVTYNLSHKPALSTGPNTFTTPLFFDRFASAAFSNIEGEITSVTVPAGGEADVDVTITAPTSLAEKGQYGGYIELSPQGGGQSYRVPYAGFKGDYQSIQALTPTPAKFPWLARLSGGSFFNQAAGATYTLKGNDKPYILVHLDHQVRRVKMEVEEVANGQSWHMALDEEYMPRNSAAASFFTLPWDGVTQHGNKLEEVPDGQYVIRLSVEKALGDEANPAHLETWTSPMITIDRS